MLKRLILVIFSSEIRFFVENFSFTEEESISRLLNNHDEIVKFNIIFMIFSELIFFG